MRLTKLILFCTLCFSATLQIHAEDRDEVSTFDEDLNQRDFRPLKQYLRTKEDIDLEDKDTELKLSGDVRFRWRRMTETENDEELRGGNSLAPDGLRITKNDFNSRFNLYLEYDGNCTWGVAQVRFDNSAGVDDERKSCEEDPEGFHGSGFCSDLCLKRAYMGIHAYDCGDTYFDVIIGRNEIYRFFDSKIQYLSRFDGLLLDFGSNWGCGDWYAKAGGFVVDFRANHLAWIIELGLLNSFDLGLDLKYSFIDWEKHGRNRCLTHDPTAFQFKNSQFTFIYHLSPDLLCTPAYFYGAYVINHCPAKIILSQPQPGCESVITQRANIGWYAGITIGEVVDAGDWVVDLHYEYVEAKSIPELDVSGIGRGNLRKGTLTSTGRGNTNYKGWKVEGLYALTDNLTLNSAVEYSSEIDKKIGGEHSFSKFELETIYAF